MKKAVVKLGAYEVTLSATRNGEDDTALFLIWLRNSMMIVREYHCEHSSEIVQFLSQQDFDNCCKALRDFNTTNHG